MLAQRAGAAALRRVAIRPTDKFFAQNLIRATLVPNIPSKQIRPIATQKITSSEAHSILAAQRLQRPVSPHLDVYDPKQTWFGASIWQRFTGGALSGAVYAYAVAYLVAPLLGWHLETQSLVAAFAAWPFAVKAGLKFAVAWPFMFHAVNGVRHLVYDLTVGFGKKQVREGGYVILGLSVVGSLGLMLL